jgi:DNA primase
MAWVNFEAIKKAVSLEMVIDHYRIELRQVSATSLRGKCPLPMHASDKSRASFTATLTKGVAGVWACQSNSCVAARGGKKGGNALDFVATMEGCSIRDAAVKMQEWFGVPTTTGESRELVGKEPDADMSANTEPSKTAALVSKGSEENGDAKNKLLTFSLRDVEPAHPYLKSRGVDEKTAREFGIGYFSGRGSMSGRIVFPIHNAEGKLVAYAGRVIDGSEPRYKFPAGFHKSLELYNLHRAMEEANEARNVVIVEGFFDCLKVWVAGFACVALMGSSMSAAQEDLLVGQFDTASVLLDGDEAGREAATNCLTRLGRQMWVWAPALPDGKEPDMLTSEEIQKLLGK